MALAEVHHVAGLTERLDDTGAFDELVGGPVTVHLEMMDDRILWGAFYPKGGKGRVTIVVSVVRGKLKVKVEDDG